MAKKQHINVWKHYIWEILSPIIDFEEDVLNPSLSDFFKNVIKPLLDDNSINENDIIIIQFKVSAANFFRSISIMQRIYVKDFNKLNDIFLGFWHYKDGEWYTQSELDSIVLFYKIINKNDTIKDKIIKIEDSKLNRHKVYNHKISDTKIPMTMDLDQWGNLTFDSDNNIAIIFKSHSNLRYYVEIEDYSHNVKLLTKNDNILFKFRDTILSRNDLYYFKREVYNKEGKINKIYIYKENELIFKSETKNFTEIKIINTNTSANPRFITMDFETKTIDHKMVPIALSIYDGKEIKSFFVSDFKDSDEMIKASIIFLIKKKYHFYKVYFHNFSNFDSVFILKHLVTLSSEIKPIIRNGVIIELKCKFGGDKPLQLYFRDSLLLLPTNLDDLAKSFDCGNKMLFPYNFVNREDIDLNYSGDVPDISFFNSISEKDNFELEYNEYKNKYLNKKWNLKKEVIKYCESDVKILHNVISKFQKRIFNHFHVDILKYPTLPSLAFAIFRSNYLEGLSISNLNNNVYDFISSGYTGGAVDLYFFKNKSDEKVYRYDVNSLYPYVMAKKEMPVGNPIEFEGNILDPEIIKQLKINFPNYFQLEPYGFFEVEVTSPNDLNIPIILKKIKILNKGFRTIAPLGRWTGVYHSNEIYNAIKMGYKFKVKKGFLFQKKIIFNDYVEFLYNLKKNSFKGSPDYIISKLLMNSLYGRFGMSPIMENHLIIKNTELDKLVLSSDVEITDTLDLENGYSLISFFKDDKMENEESLDSYFNVNIAIAASVTAEARIYMSKFKSLKNYKIFYSDTDSIDLNKPLPNELVGSELGQMKLEHIWKNVIYISNKAYMGVSENKDKQGNLETYSKIRGIKKYKLSFEELNTLLFKDRFLYIPQERWYKDRKKGVIIVNKIYYQLKSNDNKRVTIFDDNNMMVYTKPLILDKDKITN